MPRSRVRLLLPALLLALATPAFAADVTVELDAGTGFVIKNDGETSERLRVDEATGNISRNGALFVHTTGGVFVGGAGNLTSTGSFNIGFGRDALYSNTTGTGNSAFGSDALFSNTTGSGNSAFGGSSGYGYPALYDNQTGSANSAFGSGALARNTTGSRNSAFGVRALGEGGGSDNSAFGFQALFYDYGASGNSAFGAYALRQTDGTGLNSAFGLRALQFNDYGTLNVAFGVDTLKVNDDGSRNAAFGANALSSSTAGYGNVAIGSGAGRNLTTGDDNIYLANDGVAAESGKIKIGNTAHTAAYIEGIDGVTLGSGNAVYIDSSNQLGTAISSSLRTKRDVVDMGDTSEVLAKLRPVLFRYRQDVVGESDAELLHYGLIAEEVAEVAPELVTYDEEGEPNSVQYRLLTPLLLNELQRQGHTIAEQRARLAQLEREAERGEAHETEFASLQTRLDALESMVGSDAMEAGQ